jgi:hypothetical protein
VQSAPKNRGLFVDGVFVDARNGIFRHGADSRQNAALISERIVVASDHFTTVPKEAHPRF